MKIIRIALALLICNLVTFAIADTNLKIVTSFSLLKDMTEQVAGNKAIVLSLTKKGDDPHNFKATPQALIDLQKADLIIMNGLGLDDKLKKLATASGYKGKILFATDYIDGIIHDDGHHHDHDHHHGHHSHAEHIIHNVDPHAWNSLRNGIIYVENITKALVELQPKNKDYFVANANRYISKIKALDKELTEKFNSIATNNKAIMTSHNAFGYFARDYRVRIISPLGLDTQSEASAKTVTEIIKTVKQQNIKAYFTEQNVNPKLVQQIAKATNLKLMGSLYPETLSAEDGPASTYLKAFAYNANQIYNALK